LVYKEERKGEIQRGRWRREIEEKNILNTNLIFN
jgi:hypothetical protein